MRLHVSIGHNGQDARLVTNVKGRPFRLLNHFFLHIRTFLGAHRRNIRQRKRQSSFHVFQRVKGALTRVPYHGLHDNLLSAFRQDGHTLRSSNTGGNTSRRRHSTSRNARPHRHIKHISLIARQRSSRRSTTIFSLPHFNFLTPERHRGAPQQLYNLRSNVVQRPTNNGIRRHLYNRQLSRHSPISATIKERAQLKRRTLARRERQPDTNALMFTIPRLSVVHIRRTPSVLTHNTIRQVRTVRGRLHLVRRLHINFL